MMVSAEHKQMLHRGAVHQSLSAWESISTPLLSCQPKHTQGQVRNSSGSVTLV